MIPLWHSLLGIKYQEFRIACVISSIHILNSKRNPDDVVDELMDSVNWEYLKVKTRAQ